MNAAILILVTAMLIVAILLEVLSVLAWKGIAEMEENVQVLNKFLSESHKCCSEVA